MQYSASALLRRMPACASSFSVPFIQSSPPAPAAIKLRTRSSRCAAFCAAWRARCHHGLRLQPFQTVAERVFLRAEKVRSRSRTAGQGAAGEEEEEQVGISMRVPHTLMLAILRMIRMPTISEKIA